MIERKLPTRTVKNGKKRASPKVIFNLYKTRDRFRYWVLSFFLSLTRTKLLDMIDWKVDQESPIVDMGCNVGFVTRALSLRVRTIGLDVDRDAVRGAKKANKHIEFICCDLCQLPLRYASVNIVVCASVFEHIENLERALGEIKFVLKKGGNLVAGYPIETRFLEFIFRSFYRAEAHIWNQSNMVKHEERLRDPSTHKQNFSEIRKMLCRYFSLLKRRKIPRNFFPDSLSIYENVILVKNEHGARTNES